MSRHYRGLSILVWVVTLCGCAAFAGDWPNWRGPNYDGISAETGWTADWPAPGPNVLWKASIGTGFSSITVVDGRVYTMGNIEDNDIVWCFDAAAGDELWRRSYPAKVEARNYEGGPNATPTIVDGRVYTFSKQGIAHCLDAKSGEVIWRKDLKEDPGVAVPTWGHASSAVVLDGLVILNAGSSGVALKASDGSVAWESGKGPGGYASAVPYTKNGKTYLVVFSAKEAVGVEAATGKVVWRHEWKTSYDVNAADPIIVGDTVFLSSGYNRGCTLIRLADGSVSEVYENKNMRNQVNSCVLWNGHLYGFDGQVGGGGILTCLDYETGEPKWTQKGLGTGSVMLADGKLIVLGEKGKLVVAKATPDKYEELASAEVLTGKCWTAPLLANGRIYARNADGDFVCLDVSK